MLFSRRARRGGAPGISLAICAGLVAVFYSPGRNGRQLRQPLAVRPQLAVLRQDAHLVGRLSDCVVSTSGNVSGAAGLTCGGSGGATLTMTSGGSEPSIVLDYGKLVGGVPYFNVSSASGSPTLQAGYAQSEQYVSATGDAAIPWAEGDSQRYDDYTVAGAGTITAQYVQGGERYQEITLTTPGTVTLSGAGINYIADRTRRAACPAGSTPATANSTASGTTASTPTSSIRCPRSRSRPCGG